MAITTPPKGKDGKPLDAVDGQLPEDEYTRWVQRTGWAPRFGTGDDDSSSISGPNMLDHQTWVESQLSDAMYGGQYHIPTNYSPDCKLISCLLHRLVP